MKLEDYKFEMDSMEIDNVKYERLMCAIENDTYRSRKKVFATAAVAFSTAAVLGVTAAAESGFFKSMQKAFHKDEENVIIASEPSEYAFMPEIDSVYDNGITVNITEAAVDAHDAVVFMDLVFDNGIPQEILDDEVYAYEDVCFDNVNIGNGACRGSKCISVEDNVISMYINSHGINDEEWRTNGITVDFENLGCLTRDTMFLDFKTVSDISGSITIPPEQIKYNESKIAYSEIDGVPVEMELSLFGVDLIFESEEEYNRIGDMITQKEGLIQFNSIHFYMKDGSVRGRESFYKLLDSASSGIQIDGKYLLYLSFNTPLDIEQIEKVTMYDYEFVFE